MKKNFVIKILVICIFLFVSYMICAFTKYYIAPVNYEKNEIRVIIDDTEVTKNLPDVAFLKDGKIMFSYDTIKKYFDEYIYFDEKYNTVIATNDTDVVKMKLYDYKLNKNGSVKDISVPVMKIYTAEEGIDSSEINLANNDIDASLKKDENENISGTSAITSDLYIPIEELKDIYNIEVLFNEKVIITTEDAEYKELKINKKQKAKLYKKELSLTTAKIKKGEKLIVFSGDENSEYLRVRTENGNLGYIKKSKLYGELILEKKIVKEDIKKKKINLTWEYAENYTPNRVGQEKIEGLDIISPTWLYMKNESGDLKSSTISTEYIKWAKEVGYELWPTLKNDTMGITKTSLLVTDMYARENLINNVVKIAQKYDFKGINLDFENMKMEDKDEFSQFVREFSATLRRNGIIPSVDVNVPDGSETWSLCYDHKAISDACDYMMLMAYDQYGRTLAGPVASLEWVSTNIEKVLNREKVDKNKLVLCVPFYSKYRKDKIIVSGDDEIYKNISTSTLYMTGIKNYIENSKYKNNMVWDEKMGQYYVEYRNQNILERMWIEDENALKEKLQLVNKYDLAGVASWRWGFETNEVWNIINNELNR